MTLDVGAAPSPRSTGASPDRRPAWRRVAPVAFAHFAVDLAAGAFLATLPATIERLGRGGATFGALVALFSVTALALQPLLGGIADRIGYRPTAAVSGAAGAVALMGAAVAPHIALLTLGTAVGGLAAGAFHPAGATLARRLGSDSPETTVAVFAATGTVGLALGPVAGIALLGSGPGDMVLLALPAVAAAALISLGTTGGEADHTLRGPSVASVVHSLGRLVVLATLVSIAATTISSTVPLLIAQHTGRTTDLAIGIALAAFSLAMAAGGVLGSAAARRVPPTTILGAGLVTGTVTAAVALVTDPTSAAFVALLAVTGLVIGPAVPLLLVAAQDRRPDVPAAASGVVLGLANGLAGLAFLAIAAAHGSLGLEAGVAIALLGLVPAAALASGTIGRRPRSLRTPCSVAACGCVLPAIRMARP